MLNQKTQRKIMQISVVIPVYRAQDSLDELHKRLVSSLTKIGDDFEIIYVCDASPDQSWAMIEKLAKKNKRVRGINLARNFGQLSALMAGFNEIKGDYLVCLDDDLQNPPEEIEKLLRHLKKFDYDVVFASYEKKRHPLFRRLGSNLSTAIGSWLMGKPKDIYVSSFFCAKRFVIDEIVKYDQPYPYLTGLFFRTTKNVGTVQVKHEGRRHGSSGYNILKLIRLFLNGFTNFSIVPLRISSFFGFLISGITSIWIIILIVEKIIHPGVPVGWTSLIVVIAFFGGVELIGIGLLGEYIGRIFMCINKTPQFIIRDRINFP